MTALDVCESITNGLQKNGGLHEFITHPLADGGEDSIDILAEYFSFLTVSCGVSDPLGREIEAYYYLSEKTAFIELAVASGLVLLAPEEQNPMHTSTFGTGELIKDAIQKGATSIFLFVGGSATHDGGMGIAQALGFRFLDKNGSALKPCGKNLSKVAKIDDSAVSIDFTQVTITLLSDVSNPLLGSTGAAFVYAKQKGASPLEIQHLEQGLKHFVLVLRKQYKVKTDELNGAAGGVSACLVGLLKAQIESGAKKIMALTHFEQQLAAADVVISGEGRLDAQSLAGKVVGEVAKLAQKYNKPLWLFVGSDDLTENEKQSLGARKILSILDVAEDLEDAKTNGMAYIEMLAERLRFS